VSARTLTNIEARVALHFDAFSAMPIGSITTSDVLAWLADMKSSGLAPATVNSCIGTLRQIFALAALDGRRLDNPVTGVRPIPSAVPKPIVPLQPQQVVALADAIDGRYRAAILLAGLYSGCRAGELWGLTVADFDPLHARLRVERSVSETRDGLVIKSTKTGRGRTITLTKDATQLLQAHVEQYPSSGPLFTTDSGETVRHTNFMARHFRGAVRAVKPPLPPGFRFHDLRHTHASILIEQGWRADQVKDRLGHARIATTLDTYSHLFPDHDAEQLDALDAMLRESARVNLASTGGADVLAFERP
jgi:integrase